MVYSLAIPFPHDGVRMCPGRQGLMHVTDRLPAPAAETPRAFPRRRRRSRIIRRQTAPPARSASARGKMRLREEKPPAEGGVRRRRRHWRHPTSAPRRSTGKRRTTPCRRPPALRRSFPGAGRSATEDLSALGASQGGGTSGVFPLLFGFHATHCEKRDRERERDVFLLEW